MKVVVKEGRKELPQIGDVVKVHWDTGVIRHYMLIDLHATGGFCLMNLDGDSTACGTGYSDIKSIFDDLSHSITDYTVFSGSEYQLSLSRKDKQK